MQRTPHSDLQVRESAEIFFHYPINTAFIYFCGFRAFCEPLFISSDKNIFSSDRFFKTSDGIYFSSDGMTFSKTCLYFSITQGYFPITQPYFPILTTPITLLIPAKQLSVAPLVQDSSTIFRPSCTVLFLIISALQRSVARVAGFFRLSLYVVSLNVKDRIVYFCAFRDFCVT